MCANWERAIGWAVPPMIGVIFLSSPAKALNWQKTFKLP
jgi:hypothetical protein